MKTKLLALLLVLTLAVTMLASCFGTKDPCDLCVDADNDGKCDVCGGDVEPAPGPAPGPAPTPGPGTTTEEYNLPPVTWGETTIRYELSLDDNGNELSSKSKDYLSGESDGQSSVEIAARTRNGKAYTQAKVNVAYGYLEDGTAGWGASITNINAKANLETEENRPDIFCNFVYDMVSASLNKSFKNLYNNKYASAGVKENETKNYFSFAKDGKYDTTYKDTGKGYMVEYMQSLTLSETKMYLLASDYFTDLVRAFFAVPVNVALMEGGFTQASKTPGSYNYDYNNNNKYDMYDFYELVKAGGWTYDAVKSFSKDVFIEGPAANILDQNSTGRYGWVVAAGGLGASGLLYTTSVTVINRVVTTQPTLDPDDGDATEQIYEYWYPDDAAPLNDFATALNSLFTSQGVACLDKEVNSQAATSEEEEVRRAFSANQVLFGGIVCVGSLEDNVYGDMSKNGGRGFGVVPVPLFRTSHVEYTYNMDHTVKEEKTVNDTYLTQIHNIGRIAGIAVKSNKFAQCSAFLNYQSLNSYDILNDYYNLTLKTDAAGAVEGNAEMLDYIRANVRSSFDKAFEDAIARHHQQAGDTATNKNKWHNIILDANFVMQPGAMKNSYDSLIGTKGENLEKLAQSYGNLPE